MRYLFVEMSERSDERGRGRGITLLRDGRTDIEDVSGAVTRTRGDSLPPPPLLQVWS
jgi:hypothetical protein